MGVEKGILRRIGPGLVTAAVVLGPGSIVASSRAGAQASYALVWLLVVACACMAVFTSMGARLGCALTVTPLQYVAARWGRWLAVLAGLSAFLVTAGFQFGNNIGVAVGLASVTGIDKVAWPPIFTLLALAFFLGARDVYAWLERFMLALVAVMIAAFAANLFWTGADPAKLARGFVPGVLSGPRLVIAGALFATTFSAVAAFYQAYLVREKGWRRQDIPNAIGDAWAGIAVLGLIALTILVGAAQVLHGSGADFKDVGALAGQLRDSLGPLAGGVFGVGLAAASFSSFIANALIGGALMADGLGQPSGAGSRAVRAWTIVVMLAGCAVAMLVLLAGRGDTTSLLLAQSATLVAAPLCAVLLFGLTSSENVMGELRNGWTTLLLGAAGLLVMAWLCLRTAMNIRDMLAG